MEEGTLLEWQVKVGERVKRGQVVAVVDTTKAAIDVEIWREGVVRELCVLPGQTVPVGALLAILDEDGQAPSAPAPGAAAAPSPSPSPASPGALAATTRQQEIRKAIARAMSQSKREIPHYYLAEPIPMAKALAWLAQRNAALALQDRILPAALQLKAVALALRRAPHLNGWYREGAFEPARETSLGVAIALRGGGLVAPVLTDAANLPLAALMRELADLVRRARAGSLRSSQMSEPSITVTNLGEQGVQTVHGVIHPPQVALVGFGRIALRPWVDTDKPGTVSALPVMDATLAADHRVSDGHQGALFLAELRDLMQQPQALDAPAPSAAPRQSPGGGS